MGFRQGVRLLIVNNIYSPEHPLNNAFEAIEGDAHGLIRIAGPPLPPTPLVV